MPTKKGLKKYIQEPERLWELFEEYRKELKDNPRIKVEYVGREGDKVETPMQRPLTIEGFKNYCANKECDINGYWYNVDNKYPEYLSITSHIKNEIRQDQIEGGLLGAYNSNLTARINGIKDHTESVSNHNITLLNIDPLADVPETLNINAKETKKLKG